MTDFDQEPLLEVTEALIEMGGRDLLDCIACGTCSGVCPWALVRPHSVRRIIREAALGLEGFEPASWLCLTCNACVDRCPQQIDLTAVMQSMRAVAAEAGGLPAGVSAAVGSLSAAGNPWGGARENRRDWAKTVDAEANTPDADLTYFTCCTPAYDSSARRLATAAVKLLDHAGYSVTLLGDDECCCGDLALRAGRPDLAQQLAERNRRAFSEAGGHPVVTSSPHCRQAFTGWYGELESDGELPRAQHIVEALHDAWQRGALTLGRAPTSGAPQRLTYHDPCYLGRHAGIYDQPRELLRAVPGVELVEMRRNRERALCCGGGGGGAYRETAQEERHALLRIDEAVAAGAEAIVTACPLCMLMFEDAIRVKNLESSLRVVDLCEVLLASIESPQEAP